MDTITYLMEYSHYLVQHSYMTPQAGPPLFYLVLDTIYIVVITINDYLHVTVTFEDKTSRGEHAVILLSFKGAMQSHNVGVGVHGGTHNRMKIANTPCLVYV